MKNGDSHHNPSDQSLERVPAPDARLVPARPVEESNGYVGAPLAPRSRYSRYEEEQDQIDIQQLLDVLRRRWKIMLATLLSIVGLCVLYLLIAKPVYRATASLMIDAASNSGSTSDIPGLSDMLNTGSQASSVDSQVEILRSYPVQMAAIQKLPEGERQMAMAMGDKPDKYISVNSVGKTAVVNVTVDSYRPQVAAKLADAVCDEYMQQSQEQKRKQIHVATQYVGDQVVAQRQKLDRARADLRQYKMKSGITELGVETQAKISQLTQIISAHRQAEADHAAGTAQLKSLLAEVQKLAPTQEGTVTLVKSARVQALQEKLAKLELDRLEVSQEYQPDSPEVRNLDQQIQSLKGQISKEVTTEIGTRTTNPNPLHQQAMQSIAQTRSQNLALESRIKALQQEGTVARKELASVPNLEYRLSQLMTDLTALQETYQMLIGKYNSLLIAEKGSVPDARPVAKAEIPNKPASPRKALDLAMALLLGCVLAVGMAALAERLDDHVHSEDDARDVTRRPVLAHVPLIKEEGQHLLLNHSRQTSALLESYRMLRANIAFSALDEPINSIAITSSQPGEGKSTTAANLAMVMALDGKKVIIVDCDLRRPSLHQVFGLSNRVGFTSVLAGASSLDEALQETKVPGLYVLTSGPIPPNPTEMLNSKAGRGAFAQIMERADFTVLDSPPALAMADAQIVASVADAVLLVISCTDTGKRQIARTSELLSQTGAKFLGTVLSKMPASDYRKYQYYGEYLSHEDNGEYTPTESKELEKADV